MTKNHRKAFNKLRALGVPLFERRDHPTGFFISAEDENSYEWVDYWNMSRDRWNGEKVRPEIREVLEPLGLFAEWENPGCLAVWEI